VNYKLSIDDDIKAVVAETAGVADMTVFRELSDGIAALIEKTNYSNVLCDHRLIERLSDIDSNAIREYAYYMKKYLDILPKIRIASIVNTQVNYGIVRMWESFVDCINVPMNHMVFKDINEARRWLTNS
jgi:uncharacterized protein YkvS